MKIILVVFINVIVGIVLLKLLLKGYVVGMYKVDILCFMLGLFCIVLRRFFMVFKVFLILFGFSMFVLYCLCNMLRIKV